MSIPGAASPLLLASAADEEFSIERSLRFNSDDSPYLNFTPSSAGNRKTWTWSAWVKLSSGDRKVLFAQTTNQASQFFILEHRNNVLDIYNYNGGVYNSNLSTSRVFRDYSAWHHIVFTYDTTNSTADDRQRLYINGEQIENFSSRTNPSQNFEGFVNTAAVHYLSGYTSTGTLPHDGYYAEVHFIDGQSLAASDFGEYDDNNVWQPKAYSGSYGTNGWYLNFSDATNTTTIAEDSSGNGNDWTANNISVTAGSGNDSLFDSPSNGTQSDAGAGGEVSGNYCTLNNAINASHVSSNGALKFAGTTGWNSAFGTMLIPSSGKWYYEMTDVGDGTYSANVMAGIVEASSDLDATNYGGAVSVSYMYYFGNGKKILGPNNTQTTYGATGSAGDVMGIALDMDAGTLTFYKNGTSQGTAFTSLTGSYIPIVSAYNTGGVVNVNFGQRPFAYSAPSGYKCLCTANLPDPTIADGSTGMDVALYTGNGSTQTISGLNFSPDLVWIKNRSTTDNHKLTDIVRGATKELESNTTDAEVTNADGLTAFNSDGFDLGADVEYNTNTESYVAWAWDAGSSTASNTDGSITTSVRTNASAGFSIVSYTGSGTAGDTIGHGLNAVPGLVIVKRRSSTGNWVVHHKDIANTQALYLHTNSAVFTSPLFNNTSPTSSVITFNNGGNVNGNGGTYIAYCFAPVEGYSAFGSYTGNGSADGPFIYTGFRPRWIMVKILDLNISWYMFDTKRSADNPTKEVIFANLTNTEFSGTNWLDTLSNGFKPTVTHNGVNGNTYEYIYAAFAEHPFKTARAR